MNPRRAFSLVELLVALILIGAVAAGLVSALSGDRQLRDLAAAHQFASDRVRERLEQLAALPCAAATSGMDGSPWGTERWNAVVAQSAWHLTDSLAPHRLSSSLVLEARVPCPD